MLKNLLTTYDLKSAGAPNGLAFLKKIEDVCYGRVWCPVSGHQTFEDRYASFWL